MVTSAICCYKHSLLLPHVISLSLSSQVNTVFDKLYETKNYTGYVVFLEEDHFVAPDFLVVARQLIELKQSQCTDCDFINLGMYNKVRNYAGVAHRVSVCVCVCVQ